MLVARHVRRFRRTVALLQRCKDVEDIHKVRSKVPKGYSPASKDRTDATFSSPDRAHTPAPSSSSSFPPLLSSPPPSSVLVDKLLFREIPITLSLVERATVKQQIRWNRKQKKSSFTSPPLPSITLAAGPRPFFPGGLHDAFLRSSTSTAVVPDDESMMSSTLSSSHASGASSLDLMEKEARTKEVRRETISIDQMTTAPTASHPDVSLLSPSSSPLLPPLLLVDLLEGLHEAECERRWSLADKMGGIQLEAQHHAKVLHRIQHRVRFLQQRYQKCLQKRQKAKEHAFHQRDAALRISSASPRPPLTPSKKPASSGVHEADAKEKEAQAQEEEEALKTAIQVLQQRREHVLLQQRENKDDAHMLQRQSLLARPFLTAKLWRWLLQPEVWAAALRGRSSLSFTSTTSPSSSSFHASGLSDVQLVRVLWCWARVVMGVLRDVVEAHQPLPVCSPRFVVSLPTRAYRRCRPRSASTFSSPSSVSARRSSLPEQPIPTEVHHTEDTTGHRSTGRVVAPLEIHNHVDISMTEDDWNMMGLMSSEVALPSPTVEEKLQNERDTPKKEREDQQGNAPSKTKRLKTGAHHRGRGASLEASHQVTLEAQQGTTQKKNKTPTTRTSHSTPRKGAATKSCSSARLAMRWLPRSSSALLPLLGETLALWRHVLAVVNVERLFPSEEGTIPSSASWNQTASSSPSAASPPVILLLVSLLVAVQEVATTTLLLLSSPSPAISKSTTSSSTAQSIDPLKWHPVLKELESVLLLLLGKVRLHLSPPLLSSFPPVVGVSGQAATLSPILQALPPVPAAQLVLDLHRLHALSPTAPAAQRIVHQCCFLLFPQLRTNTWEVLIGRARQTSLLAFISRSQHRQLLRRGLRPESVLKDATFRSRLEQRQRAAILRGMHLSEVQLQTVVSLAESLRPVELVTLLQVLVSHLVIREEADDEVGRSPSPHEYDEVEGTRGNDRRKESRHGIPQKRTTSPAPIQRGRGESSIQGPPSHVLIAALLLGEAVLFADVFHPSSASSSSSTGDGAGLSLHHLADLWVVMAVLKPVVQASRASLPSSFSATHAAVPSSGAPLFQVLATHVIQALQGALAALVLPAGAGPSEEEVEAALQNWEMEGTPRADDPTSPSVALAPPPRPQQGHDKRGTPSGMQRTTLTPKKPSTALSCSVSLPSDLGIILHKITAGILRWEEESGSGEMEWEAIRQGGGTGGGTSRLRPSSSLWHQHPLHREVYHLTKILQEVMLSHTPSLQKELRRRFPFRSQATTPTTTEVHPPLGSEEKDVGASKETEVFQQNLIHCFHRMSLLDSVVERAVRSIGSH